MYADPLAWNFVVQVQPQPIQITGAHGTKFRKTYNATPQHDTVKTPKQVFSKPQQVWKHCLEKLGGTSAVLLRRLSAWRAAYVNLWIHRHVTASIKTAQTQTACGQGFFQSRQKCVRGKKNCSCPLRFGFVFRNNS